MAALQNSRVQIATATLEGIFIKHRKVENEPAL